MAKISARKFTAWNGESKKNRSSNERVSRKKLKDPSKGKGNFGGVWSAAAGSREER